MDTSHLSPALRLFHYGLAIRRNKAIRKDAREEAAARNLNAGFRDGTYEERVYMAARAAIAGADHLITPIKEG